MTLHGMMKMGFQEVLRLWTCAYHFLLATQYNFLPAVLPSAEFVKLVNAHILSSTNPRHQSRGRRSGSSAAVRTLWVNDKLALSLQHE